MTSEDAMVLVELLQGHIEVLEQQLAERTEELRAERERHLLCAFALARLQRQVFGRRRERDTGEDPADRPVLPNVLLGTPAANDEEPAPKRRVREHERLSPRAKARPPLELDPAQVTDKHNPVYPEERICPCCGEAKSEVGEETSTVVERNPVRYLRTTTHRIKLACSRCKLGVSIARPEDPPPSGPGPVGASLAVDIAVMHYADHLPFHRMEGIFAREGLRIDRSTLVRVAARVADLLAPVVDCMEHQLQSSRGVVGLDGTSVKILASPYCIRKTIYVLHDEAHVVFRLLQRPTAANVLSGFELFEGVLIADAATVHIGTLSAAMKLDVALCNAHARRKFFDARATDPARCDHVLRFYRRVAALERSWKDLSPEERLAERQHYLQESFDALKAWALAQMHQVTGRTPILQALSYLLTHWGGLTRFLSDGRVPWTNNRSERLLRHVAVGRHAWVFRGSVQGAERACVLWSLLQSCRALGVDPRRYLIDTLTGLTEATLREVSQWTPEAYAARSRCALALAA